jgi:hypothetical protein
MPKEPQHFPVKIKFAGVDLRAAVDQLGPGRFRAAKNLKPIIEGALRSREGTILYNGAPLPQLPVHSLFYLNDPVNSAKILMAGGNNSVYNVATQALLDSGYSGNPLSEVDYRTSGSSSAYAIVGDSLRMSKFTSAGVRTQLGITPPVAISTYTPFPNIVGIDKFTADGLYTYHSFASHTAGTTFANGVTAKNVSALQVQTGSPLPTGFSNLTRVLPMDFTNINGVPSTDGDYFHLWLNVDNSASIQEIRILFDVDPASITGGQFNSESFLMNFYWVSIAGSALTGVVNTSQTTLAARAAALAQAQTTVAQFPPGFTPGISPVNQNTAYSTQLYPGSIQWTELKIPRSQFTRSGSSGTLDWSTVQGFSITIIPTQYTQPVVTLNDFYYFGGFGPDSTYGDSGYDYRMTYKSSVTMDESNGGTIQNGAPGSNNDSLGPDYSGTSLAQVSVLNGGNNYVTGDILNVSGGNNGQIVAVRTAAGAVEIAQIYSAGWGYTANNNVPTTGGSGDNNCTLAIYGVGNGLPVQRNPVFFNSPPFSANPEMDTQCFYRRGGTLADDWRLVAQQSNPSPNSVTAASVSGTVATITTAIKHQFIIGQGVALASVWSAPTGSSQVIVTAVPTPTTFTYTVNGSQGAFTPGGNCYACDLSSDTDIASESTVPLNNDVPVTTINSSGTTVYAQPVAFLWGPFNGNTIFGIDHLRPGFVVWCNPGNPDGWSSLNNVEVTQPSDPLQNGFYWGGQPWVFSQRKLYQLTPAQVGANQYIPSETPCDHGLAARWGLAGGPSTPAVWFVAKDGVWEIEPGSAPTNITDDDLYPLFHGNTVEGNAPIDFTQEAKIRLAYFSQEVWFTFQDTLRAQQVWIYERAQSWVYDRPKRRWRQASYPWGPLCIYPMPLEFQQGQLNVAGSSNILLFGGNDGNVYKQDPNDATFTDNGTAISCLMRTGAFDFEDPQQWKEFVSVVLDYIGNGASITPTALYNDEATSVALPAVTGGANRAQQDMTLSDTYARSFSFQLAWAASVAVTIEGFEIAWRPDEMPVTHTEVPANAFDMPGYGHLYDGYITLRSNDVVNVNFYTEDPNGYAPAQIQVASTGGQRQRIYLQCGPNKSRNFRVSLDSASTTPFRVYAEDSYINIMPWGAITPTPVQLPFAS